MERKTELKNTVKTHLADTQPFTHIRPVFRTGDKLDYTPQVTTFQVVPTVVSTMSPVANQEGKAK